MAEFQQIALDYLEHYQPSTFEALKRVRGLLPHVEALVERLYSETERVQSALAEQYPERSADLIRLEAEEIAIAAVLPMSESPDQPSQRLNGLMSAVSISQQSNGWEAQQ